YVIHRQFRAVPSKQGLFVRGYTTTVLLKILSSQIVLFVSIINRSGITIRTAVSDIRVAGRATQGVKIINLREGDSIASVMAVPKNEEEEAINQGAEGAEGAEVVATESVAAEAPATEATATE
ncbi:MAG: hypothetical protein IIX00_03700, partial [Tidjanibacter sp.]|nr:hypothetical protein [Tidjanibacter sp.]